MSQARKVMCGTPETECTGSKAPLIPGMPGKKTHSSNTEAFRCYRRHLIAKGYTPVGSRAFSPPDGGPVLILSKKTRFGGGFRRGKSDGIAGNGAGRFMPSRFVSGLVF
jgi:hypothetical protein